MNFYVIKRADKFALRIKDAKSPSLLEFHGLKWFEPESRLSRHSEVDAVRSGKKCFAADARWHRIFGTCPRIRGIHAARKNFSPGAGARRSEQSETLFHFARYYQHGNHLPCLPIFVHHVSKPRRGSTRRIGARLQSSGKSAMRLHAVRHLPAASRRKPFADRVARRRTAVS